MGKNIWYYSVAVVGFSPARHLNWLSFFNPRVGSFLGAETKRGFVSDDCCYYVGTEHGASTGHGGVRSMSILEVLRT